MVDKCRKITKPEFDVTVQVEHRLHITNVIVQYMHQDDFWIRYIRKYQFIHRLYPTLESILGGFDLGPSMVAYDGVDIWATELGAWTYANNAMIIDISRRSTTFTKRITKYSWRNFRVIFPGIRYAPFIFPTSSLEERIAKLKQNIWRFVGTRNGYEYQEETKSGNLYIELKEFLREIGLKWFCNNAEIYYSEDYYDEFLKHFGKDWNCPQIKINSRQRFNVEFETHFEKRDAIFLSDLCVFPDQIGPKYKNLVNEQDPKKNRDSDYGDWTDTEVCIRNMNTTLLSEGKLDAVTTVITHEQLQNMNEVCTIENLYNEML